MDTEIVSAPVGIQALDLTLVLINDHTQVVHRPNRRLAQFIKTGRRLVWLTAASMNCAAEWALTGWCGLC